MARHRCCDHERHDAVRVGVRAGGSRASFIPSKPALAACPCAAQHKGRWTKPSLLRQGRAYPIRATVTQALESEGIKGEAGKIGAGAGVGAIIGAILGGAKGALAGILIGGGARLPQPKEPTSNCRPAPFSG